MCVTILPYDAKAHQEGEKKHSLKLNDLFAVEFLSLMLLATLFSSANGLATTYLDILATERGIPNISLFFTAYAVALLIVKPITGRLQDKKGLYFVMIPAVVFAALGTFLGGRCLLFSHDGAGSCLPGPGTGGWNSLAARPIPSHAGRLKGGGGGVPPCDRPESRKRPGAYRGQFFRGILRL